MRYLNTFTLHPQYHAQYIIQLYDNDPISEAACRSLYYQNTELNAWYRYDRKNNQLKKVESAANLHLKHETRVTLVGNGSLIAFSMDTIAHILGKKSSRGGYDRVNRKQVTLLGCGLTNMLPTNSPKRGELKQGIIKQLYQSLRSNNVFVNSIIVQESLFTIDVMGHRWSGQLFSERGRSLHKIDWIPTKVDAVKIKFTRQDNTITYEYQSIEQDVARRTKVITPFEKDGFLLTDTIQLSTIYITELSDWVTETSEKLDGLMDEDIARSIKTGASLNTSLLMNSESMVLIAGMSAGCGEILIADGHYHKIAILMKILEQTQEKKTYKDWFEALTLTCGRKRLEDLITRLFGDPQTAFLRLKKRVTHNRFTFYQFNLNGNADLILQSKHSKEMISRIYLGDIDDSLLVEDMRDDDNPTKLNKVTATITQLNAAINKLNRQHTIPLHYYSFFQRQDKSEQPNNKNTQLMEKYGNTKYIQKYENFNFTRLHPNIHVISRFNLRMRLKRTELALKDKNQSFSKDWVMIFAEVKYNPIGSKYVIPFINTKDFTSVKELEVSDNFFEELRQYLDDQTQSIDQYHQFAQGRVRPKLVGKIGGAGGIASVYHSFLSVYDAFQYGVNQIPGDSMLARAVQAHVYISLMADSNNLANTLGTAGELTLKAIANQLRNSGHFGIAATSLGKYNTLLAKGNLALSIFSFGLNSFELLLAENETQRSTALTRMAFDIVSIVLGCVGLVFTSPLCCSRLIRCRYRTRRCELLHITHGRECP